MKNVGRNDGRFTSVGTRGSSKERLLLDSRVSRGARLAFYNALQSPREAAPKGDRKLPDRFFSCTSCPPAGFLRYGLKPVQRADIGAAMSNLAGFLMRKLETYGAQLDFSRKTGISPGTITKWTSGQNSPNFESCLLIADYFHTDPTRIFKMVGKLNYYRLYLRHFDKLKHQAKLHSRLQQLLESGLEDRVEDFLSELEADQESFQQEIDKSLDV
jgi:transcriptional regulator with XRE-family HTH domain